MQRYAIVWIAGLLVIVAGAGTGFAHPGLTGHDHADPNAADGSANSTLEAPVLLALAETRTEAAAAEAAAKVTGQGKYRFRLLYAAGHLPAKAVEVLKKAHGGFAVDRRPGKGEVYFALPGAGIIQISGDLKSTRLLDTPPAVRDVNLHNALIWYTPQGEPYLAFPANDAGKVFTTSLDGKLIHTLEAPTADDDLGHPTVNDYFRDRTKRFTPTDVEELDGLYYIPTGYSPLDFVLTAKVTLTPFNAVWNKLSFGGKGTAPGQLQTGHGITVPKGTKRLDVADRPNSEIDRFAPDGKYLETLALPKGSLPCDTFYQDDILVIGCLEGPDKSKGAPIYIFEKDKLVSTLMPKEDLGLTDFQHVHNAVCVIIHKKLYVIAQAWNPGDFAILEQVGE